MTEIPEHLLKRSRDRRAALGLGGGDSPDEETSEQPAAATPATTEEATPAAPAPTGPAARKALAVPAAAPPKPDSPVVAAAKRRARIPVWAMAALSLMPVWVFMYVRSLTEAPAAASGPMGIGAEVFSGSCASCHGASGAGSGSARQLSDGEVTLTFPHIEDQLRFVYFGTEQYSLAGVESYGDPNRPNGPHLTGEVGLMPGWGGELSDAEILGAVCEVRFGLNGPSTDEEPWAAEFEHWCAEESPIFRALEEGTALAELHEAGIVDAEGELIEIRPIGDAPAPGSS